MVLRPREDVVDKEFFPLFISSDYFLDAAIKISVGSLSPTINWRDLKDLEFELPPFEGQKKLAEALWAVNRTIETYKNLLEKTDELVKSQFMEMFGDVTKTAKFPTIEPDSLFFQAAILYGVLTGLNKGAFEDCSGLTSVTIGDSVMSIGDSDFI